MFVSPPSREAHRTGPGGQRGLFWHPGEQAGAWASLGAGKLSQMGTETGWVWAWRVDTSPRGVPPLPRQGPRAKGLLLAWSVTQRAARGTERHGGRADGSQWTSAERPPTLPPTAWPQVPSQRPEPLNTPQRSPGNSVSVFTPPVSASESFILTADCIKIPVVIGSGAVFSMRILNQAFCPRPERSVSEYKDARDGITQGIFPPLNFLPPPLIMAALYLLPNKLGRPPLPQL